MACWRPSISSKGETSGGAAAIHSAWNFVQGNVFGVSVSGTGSAPSLLGTVLSDAGTIWNGGAFGLEGGLCVTVVTLLAIAAVIFLLPTNKDEVSQKTDDLVAVNE